MNHETAWRVLWCLWFACVMGGPYVLGNHGDAYGWMYSGSYGFVAFGLLLGIWAGQTAVVRVACRNEKAKWSLLGAGLGLNLLLVLLELFALLLPVALDSLNFSALLLQEESGVPYDWVLDLSGAGVEVGYYEKGLAFIFAVLCGTAFQASPSQAIDFKNLSGTNNGDVVCLGRAPFGRWNEATVRAILVALPGIVFALGVTRTSIGATFAMPVGLLMAVCIALSLAAASMIVPLGGMHCLVPFCLGELTFRAACRFGLLAVPMGKGCALLMLAVHGLCLLVVLTIAMLWHRASARFGAPSRLGSDHVVGACSETGFSDETIRRLLNGAGLSNRELEVLAACSNGLDSAQVAQRLGMQASTVRTYRSRICKKLGYQTIHQLLAELSKRACYSGAVEEAGVCFRGEGPARGKAGISKGLVAEMLRFVGVVSLFILLLMPYGRLAFVWDATWVMAYSAAAGLLLATGCAHVLHALGQHASLRGALPYGLAALLVVFAAGCLVCQSGIAADQTALSFPQRMGLLCSVAGFVCTSVLYLRRDFCILPATTRGVLVAVGCVSALVLLALFSEGSWRLACVVSMLAVIAGAVLASGVDCATMHVGNVRAGNACAVTALACFGVAFVWEETWRATAFDSLQSTGLVMLVLFNLAMLHVLRCNGARWSICGIAIGCACLLIWAKGLCFGLLVGLAILVAVRILQRGEGPGCTDSLGKRGLCGCVAAAMGCCVAVYAANIWGATKLYEFDNTVNPDVIAVLCAFLCMLAGAACCLFAWAGMDEEGRDLPNVSTERLEGFLIGKGLTPGEVRVAIALSRGSSMAQVAEELSYSLSTVNSMRRRAFAKLGIRTRHHLLRLLWDEFDPKRVG